MNKLNCFLSLYGFGRKVMMPVGFSLALIASCIAMERNAFKEESNAITHRLEVSDGDKKRLEGSEIKTLFWGPYFHIDFHDFSECGEERFPSDLQEWAKTKCGNTQITKISVDVPKGDTAAEKLLAKAGFHKKAYATRHFLKGVEE